jgi:hypothetical protein
MKNFSINLLALVALNCYCYSVAGQNVGRAFLFFNINAIPMKEAQKAVK